MGIRFGRDELIREFLQSGRSGFYLAVLQEGTLAAGNAFERLSSTEDETVAAVAARIAKRRLDEGS